MRTMLTKIVSGIFILVFLSLPTWVALADVVAPSAPAAPQVVAPVSDAPVVAPADFLSQVLDAVHKFGGLSTLMKVSTVILLIIASLKVSVLNQLVWSKLGAYQSLVAPLLGLVAGVVGLFGGGAPVTITSIIAYLGAGVGAMGLHEVLDDIKALPGIGSKYVSMINFIESLLGGSSSQPKV